MNTPEFGHARRRALAQGLTGGLGLVAVLSGCGGGGSSSDGGGGGTGGGGGGGGTTVVPAITSPPASQTVTAGAAAGFSVIVTGTTPLTYQWLRNGIAVSGANSASFSLVAGESDNGARYAVTVSNAAGSVTSDVAVLTVLSAATSTPYWVAAWTSLDATAGSGSLSLLLVDPERPADPPVPVDTLPALAAHLMGGRVRVIRGGDLEATSGQVVDAAPRHVAYFKGGRVWRLPLTRSTATPVPVQVSSETQVSAGSALQVCAISDGGDQALLAFASDGASGLRYAWLTDGPATMPRAAPQFAPDLFGSLIIGWTVDAGGRISRLLWTSFPGSGGARLFSTDLDFGDLQQHARFSTSIDTLWLGLGTSGGGRMKRGQFFIAEGDLHRLDFATLSTRVVLANVERKLDGGLFDETHLYLRVTDGTTVRLVRATDDDSTPGEVLGSGADFGASFSLAQTRTHLVRIGGSALSDAATMAKTGSTWTPLPAATPGLGELFTWNSPFGLVQPDTDRVYYQVGLRTGSVRADGSDRREHAGLPITKMALPARVSPHCLQTSELRQLASRALLRDGNTIRWLDLATGDLGVIVGMQPAGAMYGNATLPYSEYVIGRAGSFGWQRTVAGPGGAMQPRLDAVLVGEAAGSLRRLSTNIP